MLKINASVITHNGKVRPNNEDNFYLNGLFMRKIEYTHFCELTLDQMDKQFIFAVCDGMGGEEYGEEASLTTIQTLSLLHRQAQEQAGSYSSISDLRKLMDSIVDRSNTSVFGKSSECGKRMGTTLASVILYEHKAMALNIGDSRVYLLRNNDISKLTEDHTQAERLKRMGVLDKDNALYHKSKHILTRYLGASPVDGGMEADYTEAIEILKGDIFLICSDGLTDLIDDGEINRIILSSRNSITSCRNLVDKAIQNGGADNVTALIVKIYDVIYP